MAEKDISEKLLEDYNDVFADIANVLLFDGEAVIGEDSLEKAQEYSVYNADGKYHEQERDTAKYWKDGNVTISFLGIGNQSSVDNDSALRVMGYDGAAYRAQLYTEKTDTGAYVRNKNPRYPVVTMILYFGKGSWTAPKNLKASLNTPERIAPFVSDYHINVFEIRKLSRKQVDMFKSDFWIVADYFYQIEHDKKYVPNETKIKHVEEVMRMLSVLNNDNRFEMGSTDIIKEGKVDNMCEVLDQVENRGIEKGKILGSINILYDMNIPSNEIESKIMSKYNLDRETADMYIKQCVKA